MSQSFQNVHEDLSRMARNGGIRYVLRHYVRARPEGSVKLSGSSAFPFLNLLNVF